MAYIYYGTLTVPVSTSIAISHSDLLPDWHDPLISHYWLYICSTSSSIITPLAISIPHVWNNLPANVLWCNTQNTFKRHLKTHLFLLMLRCHHIDYKSCLQVPIKLYTWHYISSSTICYYTLHNAVIMYDCLYFDNVLALHLVYKLPPRTRLDHIWAEIWSAARGNIARTVL